MWVQSLCWEVDPLEKEMATHSSSSLENPMDRRAWWATVHRVTKFNCINLAQLGFSKLTFPYSQ